jgi:two-component system, LytTR family, response regulator
MKMKAIVVDDVELTRNTTRQMVEAFCEDDVEVIGEAESVTTAIKIINQLKPDLVFMDLDLGAGREVSDAATSKLQEGKSGFDVLNAFDLPLPFEVIFVTAYQGYAIDAFELAAIGYVLKPLSPAKLIKYVERAKKKRESKSQNMAYNIFKENQQTTSFEEQFIAVPLVRAVIEYVPIKDIIYMKSDKDCTLIYLVNNRKVVSVRGIGKFEKRLELENGKGFLRVHQSALVNPLHVKKFFRNDAYLEMSNGDTVSVSRSKRNLRLLELE